MTEVTYKVWLLQETTSYYEAEVKIQGSRELHEKIAELREQINAGQLKAKDVRKKDAHHYKTKLVEKPVFTVPVTYQMDGLYKIPADTLEEAEEMARKLYNEGKEFDAPGDYADLIRVGNAYIEGRDT